MKQFKLKSGIPVVLADMNGTNVVTALILFKVGSRNEGKSINGVSHFLEHLFFKGTENRPTTLDISKELDGVGADFNAFTSKDYTGYYVKVAKQHASLAIDILEDLLFHPLFDPEEVDRERGVIVEEINMYKDNPMATADELAEELLFGANHPLGYRIAGPPKTIMSIPRQKILDYRNTYYRPNNMVVVLAGNLPKNIRSQVSKQFDGSAPKSKRIPAYKKFTYTQKSPRVHLERKKTAQSHLALSFPGPTYKSKDAAVAQVLSGILGGNMSSRLFINVRERQGVCYYIRSHVSPYEDMGAFTIQAGFDTKRIHKAITAITEQLVDLRDIPVDADELKKAKEYIQGKMSIRMEDSENVAQWWARRALFYSGMDSHETAMKKINAVTAKQVQALAKKTFDRKKANLVVVGPYSSSQKQSFKKHLLF